MSETRAEDTAAAGGPAAEPGLSAKLVADKAKEARTYRRALEKHVSAVRMYLQALDTVMKRDSGHARGKEVAGLSNLLELANDMVDRFTLGNAPHAPAGRASRSRRNAAAGTSGKARRKTNLQPPSRSKP